MTRLERTQRLVLATALFVAFVGMLWECPPVTQLPFPKGLSAWIDMAPLTQPIPRYSIDALVGVLLVLWALRKSEVVIPIFVVLLTFFLSFIEEGFHATTADVSQGKSMPFAAWIAYVIGSQFVRPTVDRPDAERNGREMAAGTVAAGYTMAGLSKVFRDGASWFDGRSMAMMIAERADEWPDPIHSIRVFMTFHPGLCAAGMGFALVVELCGLTYLKREWRFRYAFATFLMHSGIRLLLGYFHIDWWSNMVTIAWWSTSKTEAERAVGDP